ncbi:MAG TPA: MFS transporter, partial [Patescibacteria group bacterium]
YIASVVAFINLIFILRFLPESLTQKAEKLIIREGFVNIKAIIYGLKGESGAFFFILFGWAFAISNLQVAFPLFSEKAFNFTSVENGYMFAYLGAVNATTQWFFVNKMTRLFGELKTVAMGVLFMATGQFLIPFSPVLGILLLVYSISSVGSSLFRPTTSAIISKRTKEGQGTTMGLAFSFESLGRIAGPLSAGVLIAIFGTKIQFILTSLVLYLGFIYLLISFREPITQFKADSSQN